MNSSRRALDPHNSTGESWCVTPRASGRGLLGGEAVGVVWLRSPSMAS